MTEPTAKQPWHWVLAGLVILLCGAAIVSSMMKANHEESVEGEPGKPLLFLLSPDHGMRITADQRVKLADLLRKESGLDIRIEVAASPLEAIEAFGTRADIGLLPIFQYLLARHEYGVQAGMQVLRRNGPTGYAGVIVVRNEDPILAVTDLAGKRMAYVDPYSTSGFIFPAKIVADAHIKVVSEFTGSHQQALDALRAGRADAAATYSSAVAGDTGLRIIAQTDIIPNEPIFYRADLLPEKRDRLSKAFMKLAESSEEQDLLASLADITGLQPSSDQDYLGVIATARAAGKSVFELVPEGVLVESRRRGIEYIP